MFLKNLSLGDRAVVLQWADQTVLVNTDHQELLGFTRRLREPITPITFPEINALSSLEEARRIGAYAAGEILKSIPLRKEDLAALVRTEAERLGSPVSSRRLKNMFLQDFEREAKNPLSDTPFFDRVGYESVPLRRRPAEYAEAFFSVAAQAKTLGALHREDPASSAAQGK